MRLDEEQERELVRGLEQRLGGRTTELLMKRSEPVDLSHLATKADLEALDHKVDLLRHELIAEIHRTGRNQLLGFAAIVAVFNTGLFAAVSVSGL